MVFKWIVLLDVLVIAALADTNFKGCMKQNTYGYAYLELYSSNLLASPIPKGKLFDPRNDLYIEFYVKANDNAHILLSDSEDKNNAYEIVLGGGSNTFSQIRLVKQKTKKSVKTVRTDQIVSANDLRGFWIESDSHGYIFIGKLGEEAPFLNWENKQPFRVEYVSFSTWTNVRGEWYFACPKGFSLETLTGRNLSTTERLRDDLFSYYNPNVFPYADDEPSRVVQMRLDIKHFTLNEKQGKLELTGSTDLNWRDRKLTWNSSYYDGIDTLYVTPHQVWTPNVRVLNSITMRRNSLLSVTGGVVIQSNGTLYWRAPFYSATFCVLSFGNWPFDAHNCSLTFGFLNEPFKLQIKQLNLSKTVKSEWLVKETVKTYEFYDVIPGPNRIVHMYLQRNNPALITVLILPCYICAAVLSLLSFWMEPNSLTKLFFNCGSLCILIVSLVGLLASLPTMTAPIPEIVYFHIWSILIMCFPILFFIGLQYMPSNFQPSDIFIKILDSSIIQTCLCLPEVKHEIQNKQFYWDTSILVTFVERFVFWIYFTLLLLPFVIKAIHEQLY